MGILLVCRSPLRVWLGFCRNFSVPAPGYRNRDAGTLYYAGKDGFSCSSSVNGSNARYLGFNDSWINPQIYIGRSSGLPVRCLLE